jgi:hypothetical protein
MTDSITSARPTYSRKAITSFLMGGLAVSSGVLAVVLDFPALMAVMLASIFLSVLLGGLARRQVRRSQGRFRGSGLAGWGIALGLIGILFVGLLPAR